MNLESVLLVFVVDRGCKFVYPAAKNLPSLFTLAPMFRTGCIISAITMSTKNSMAISGLTGFVFEASYVIIFRFIVIELTS